MCESENYPVSWGAVHGRKYKNAKLLAYHFPCYRVSTKPMGLFKGGYMYGEPINNNALVGAETVLTSARTGKGTPLKTSVFEHISQTNSNSLCHNCPTHLSCKCSTHLNHKCPTHLSRKCHMPVSNPIYLHTSICVKFSS